MENEEFKDFVSLNAEKVRIFRVGTRYQILKLFQQESFKSSGCGETRELNKNSKFAAQISEAAGVINHLDLFIVQCNLF